MISRYISLKSKESAIRFVDKASKYPYHINLSKGCLMIDGKSMLGVLGLGVRQILKMDIVQDEASDLLVELDEFLEIKQL